MAEEFELETRLLSLIDNVPCGILIFKLDGTILQANKTLGDWLGSASPGWQHKNITDLLDSGGRLYYQLFIQALLKLHNEVKEINFQMKTDHANFPCLFSAKHWEQASSSEELFIAAIYKVAEREKYENELLLRKVKAEEEKEEKSAVLEEVAFNQSHLVRAPLANILGIISLMNSENMDEEQKKMFFLLQESAYQLDSEIRKIVSKTNI